MSTEFRCQACNGTFEGMPIKMQFAWPSSCKRGNGTYDVCEACAKIFKIEKGKAPTSMLFDTATIEAQPVANTFFVMPKGTAKVRILPPEVFPQYFKHHPNRKLECPFPGCKY